MIEEGSVVSNTQIESKKILSINLMSCLEDIDKDIEVRHKDVLEKKTFQMDENRFRQIRKQPRKMTKYEEEYMQ